MMDIKEIKKEDGAILILFAVSLSFLIVFTALTTDIIFAYNRKDHLNEVGQMMREARFDFAEEVWNAYDPQAKLEEISRDIGRRNGLRDDQVQIIWQEVPLSRTRREAKIDVIITDTYETTTLKMLGIQEIPIKVVIKGHQSKYHGNGVWSPWF